MKFAAKKQALELVSSLIQNSPSHFADHFEDKRDLLGFQIRWLKTDLHNQVCEEVGLKPEDTEIILMQAFDKTDCHLHSEGCTLFKTLGPAHGFPEPGNSGVLTTMYKPDQSQYDLEMIKFEEGELSLVVPYQIHAFSAEKGKVLTALGVVSPRIRNSTEEFDIAPFHFVSERTVCQSVAA